MCRWNLKEDAAWRPTACFTAQAQSGTLGGLALKTKAEELKEMGSNSTPPANISDTAKLHNENIERLPSHQTKLTWMESQWCCYLMEIW